MNTNYDPHSFPDFKFGVFIISIAIYIEEFDICLSLCNCFLFFNVRSTYFYFDDTNNLGYGICNHFVVKDPKFFT